MSISPNADGVVKLAYWLSPAFPVGAFAYSHGLEQAIADETITNAETLFDWIAFLLERGSAFNDAIFLRCAVRNWDQSLQLKELNQLSLALASSAERYREQVEMGSAFIGAVSLTEPVPNGIEKDRCAYFVALGAFCGQRKVAPQIGVQLALQSFASNLVSVAQRLVPIGQTDGVKTMSKLEPVIEQVAARVVDLDIKDIGSAALNSDFVAMKHEDLHVRIFRT